jgi:hypothetical protein
MMTFTVHRQHENPETLRVMEEAMIDWLVDRFGGAHTIYFGEAAKSLGSDYLQLPEGCWNVQQRSTNHDDFEWKVIYYCYVERNSGQLFSKLPYHHCLAIVVPDHIVATEMLLSI